MHGNVGEWCEDWKADYTKDPVADPKGPNSGKYRVLRGGSFFNAARHTRSANRFGNLSPVNRHPDTGFRLARTP